MKKETPNVKVDTNCFIKSLKEKNYDEELLSQKESEYFEDESEDDYEERVKNYYKNKMFKLS